MGQAPDFLLFFAEWSSLVGGRGELWFIKAAHFAVKDPSMHSTGRRSLEARSLALAIYIFFGVGRAAVHAWATWDPRNLGAVYFSFPLYM